MWYVIIIIWAIDCPLDGMESGDNTWFRFMHMSMFLRGQYLDMYGEEMKKSQFQKEFGCSVKHE